ncbi:MAG: di-trans,poly-cis-decaprenylcistransferase [Candidatus Buchananbacteria bacterium]|nr:di-trans,poly-cis-decaprenylcistransferase [Candidatus Buchananbacteria bacterium]
MAEINQLAHLGIIMDGNRRWAKNNGLASLVGHRKGYEKMKEVASWCIEAGVKVLTVYAFSTENWNRSEYEVKYLMDLFRLVLKNDLAKLAEQGIRVNVIGQKERLDADIQDLIAQAEIKTKNNQRLIFNLAISYGGRPEIIQAVKKIIDQKIAIEKIDEDLIKKFLWTDGLPDPDLIIRTSGEHRLSNFLTWQSVYSELLFIDKHWPDFSQADLQQAIEVFNNRQRRYGK